MSLQLSLDTMVTVGLYVVATAPFLPLLLVVHRLAGAYTALFVAALVLQLIPIGLVFVPLGGLGVAILAYTLWAVRGRLRAFREAGLANPEVHARWIREYLANLVAFGCAIEQKGAALLFLEASSGGGLGHLWTVFLPASVMLWAAIAWPLHREWRALREVEPVP